LVFVGLIGGLARGLLVAVAAFALVAYRERRDPTLLLAGVGAGAAVAHDILVAIVFSIVTPSIDSAWIGLVSFAPIAGMLALTGALIVVVPWQDRRGRPALRPRTVVRATLAALFCFDLLIVVTRADPVTVYAGALQGLGAIGLLAAGALVAGGAIITVRSLQWGGRFGWVAAAGLGVSFVGLGTLLSTFVDSDRTLQIVGGWASSRQALAAAALVVFVIASLKIETSRQRRVNDRATEVMEGRAEIAATIAHDVRGPVGTIKGLATTTRKSYERLDDAQRLEFVGMIEEESGRLLRLVDQVALALKIDAGSLDLVIRHQEVGSLVEQAVAQVEPGEHPIAVDAPAGIEAAVDTRWFPEAVRQLVDNAARFSPPDAPIAVVARRGADGGAVVVVTDAGPGIPAEQRDAVFEKFTSWRPPGYEDRMGSGLGLFVTRGIIRGHGGDVTLDDVAAGGTMLRIRVPREAD
jgi:signal transduction histidine kinase